MTAAQEEPAAPAEPVPPALPRVRFTEGSITLPAGYEDRTTNLFVPGNTQTQANLNVARDWMKPEETLDTYVDRQLSLLKAQLAGHRVITREPVRLGSRGEEDTGALNGIRIDAHYKNGKLTIYQRQAAFEVEPRRALVFTASKANSFGAAFEQQWQAWLASYEAPPPPADESPNPQLPASGP